MNAPNLIKFLLTLCSMLNHVWQSICLIHAALVKVELTDPWWVTWFYENLRLCEFKSFSIILNNLGGPSINSIIKKMISFNSYKLKLFVALLTSDVVVPVLQGWCKVWKCEGAIMNVRTYCVVYSESIQKKTKVISKILLVKIITSVLNPCMKFKKHFQKDFFWSIMKVPYPENIHNMSQGPPNPRFRSVKIKTEDFLIRTHNISKILFNLGSWGLTDQLNPQFLF